MLSPLLLNLYNAAVRSLPENRKTQERQIAEELDAAYKAATSRLDKLVNGLEKQDEAAIKEALQSGIGSGATFTVEQSAFFHAIQEAVFPAPEGIAQSSVTLSTLMESLPPVDQATLGTTNAVEPFPNANVVTVNIEIPPQSPPAEVPARAVAEPKFEYVCAACKAPADETKGKLVNVGGQLMHEILCAPPPPAVTPAEPGRSKPPKGLRGR